MLQLLTLSSRRCTCVLQGLKPIYAQIPDLDLIYLNAADGAYPVLMTRQRLPSGRGIASLHHHSDFIQELQFQLHWRRLQF